jgi:hypothetical protein
VKLSTKTWSVKGELPPRRLTEVIEYSGSGDVPAFKCHNNLSFVKESRHLVIEMEEGLRGDPISPAKLGYFRIPLNRIDGQCPPDGSPIILTEMVSPSEVLAKANIEIEYRKYTQSREHNKCKEAETIDEMSEVLENIVRFNEEHAASGSFKLTGNLRGRGGISLLHAAIKLQREDFVEKLVDLGANPKGKSVVETPLGQAIKMREKIKQRQASDVDDSAPKSKEYLLGMCQRMIDLLSRGSKTSENDPEDEINFGFAFEQTSIYTKHGVENKLPELIEPSDWLLPSGAQRCYRFNRADGCHFGSKCKFIHIRDPVGDALDNGHFFDAKFPECILERQLIVKKMGPWYTAKYHEEEEKTYYYAERGPGHRQSNQGIYWYQTRKDAEEALRRVLIISKGIQPRRNSCLSVVDLTTDDPDFEMDWGFDPTETTTPSWSARKRASWGDGDDTKQPSKPAPSSEGSNITTSTWGERSSTRRSWGDQPRIPSWGNAPRQSSSTSRVNGEKAQSENWGGATSSRPTWGVEESRRPSCWGDVSSQSPSSPQVDGRPIGRSSSTLLSRDDSKKESSWGEAPSRPSWGDNKSPRPSWGGRTRQTPSSSQHEDHASTSSSANERKTGTSWGKEDSSTKPLGGNKPQRPTWGGGSRESSSSSQANAGTSSSSRDGSRTVSSWDEAASKRPSWGDKSQRSSWGGGAPRRSSSSSQVNGEKAQSESKSSPRDDSTKTLSSWGEAASRPSWGEKSRRPTWGNGSCQSTSSSPSAGKNERSASTSSSREDSPHQTTSVSSTSTRPSSGDEVRLQSSSSSQEEAEARQMERSSSTSSSPDDGKCDNSRIPPSRGAGIRQSSSSNSSQGADAKQSEPSAVATTLSSAGNDSKRMPSSPALREAASTTSDEPSGSEDRSRRSSLDEVPPRRSSSSSSQTSEKRTQSESSTTREDDSAEATSWGESPYTRSTWADQNAPRPPWGSRRPPHQSSSSTSPQVVLVVVGTDETSQRTTRSTLVRKDGETASSSSDEAKSTTKLSWGAGDKLDGPSGAGRSSQSPAFSSPPPPQQEAASTQTIAPSEPRPLPPREDGNNKANSSGESQASSSTERTPPESSNTDSLEDDGEQASSSPRWGGEQDHQANNKSTKPSSSWGDKSQGTSWRDGPLPSSFSPLGDI